MVVKEIKELLVKDLKPIEDTKLIRAYKKYCYFEILDYYKHYYCSCCGEEIKHKIDIEHKTKTKCKNCGASLIYGVGRTKTTYSDTKVNIAYSEVEDDTVFERIYEVGYYAHPKKECEFRTLEVVRRFYTHDLKTKYFSRRDLMGMCGYWYNRTFNPNTDLKLRKTGTTDFNSTTGEIFIVKDECKKYKYLDFKIINEILSSNAKYFVDKINFTNMIERYKENQTLYETFQNTKRYDLLKMYINNNKLAPALMTMCKHNRKAYDLNFYDYLVNLIENKEDLKNIEVVCPSTKEKYLKKAVEQENKWTRAKDKKELDENIKRYNMTYAKHIENLIHKDFGNDNYTIKVLENVQEFYDTAMDFKNCVYRMGYYKSDISYIFKIKDRVSDLEELAELKLEDNKIRINQCYAHFNKESSKHDEIMKLLNERKEEIKKIICQK